jgi:hypothetical protein
MNKKNKNISLQFCIKNQHKYISVSYSMNEIRQYEMIEEIQQKLLHKKQLDEKIKIMSEDEKDLLYQKIIMDEKEVKRKIERDTTLYNYFLSKEN